MTGLYGGSSTDHPIEQTLYSSLSPVYVVGSMNECTAEEGKGGGGKGEGGVR